MLTLLGTPNGDPDGPYKWDFLFAPIENLTLQVIRTTQCLELWWWGEIEVSEADVLTYLDKNIAKYENIVDKTIGGLEHYTLVLNPFVRHRTMANLALEELDKLNPVEPALPIGHNHPHAVLQDYVAKRQEFDLAVSRQASLMLLLVTESAFMAESFVNLILAVFMRPEVRASEAIRNETLMRKWKSKIERLHVDCVAIPTPVNSGDVRMRDAKKLFDIRNRVAHSYPDTKEMNVGEMWFFRRFPVLAHANDYMKFAIALNNQLPSPAEARFCKKAADDLVELLTDLVESETREGFKMVMDANPLGYNDTLGIYGVPFGNRVCMVIGSLEGAARADDAKRGADEPPETQGEGFVETSSSTG